MEEIFQLIGVLVVMGVALWFTFRVLEAVFIQAKRLMGWLGPYVVSIVPSAAVYVATQAIFGAGNYEASIAGFVTAAIAGTALNITSS